ncbi:MAG TPA: hypothetical protein VL405_06460 [Sphingomonas sp.]|jgi:hypothetical protein|nr:hypothetical protein [Sphingomonas sp.]
MNEDEAKRRFFALSAIRFCGLALALLGVWIVSKRSIEPADVIGYLLIAAGAFDVIVLPPLLIRRWKR